MLDPLELLKIKKKYDDSFLAVSEINDVCFKKRLFFTPFKLYNEKKIINIILKIKIIKILIKSYDLTLPIFF